MEARKIRRSVLLVGTFVALLGVVLLVWGLLIRSDYLAFDIAPLLVGVDLVACGYWIFGLDARPSSLASAP